MILYKSILILKIFLRVLILDILINVCKWVIIIIGLIGLKSKFFFLMDGSCF